MRSPKNVLRFSQNMCRTLSYELNGPKLRSRYNKDFADWLESQIYDTVNGGFRGPVKIDLTRLSDAFVRQLYKILRSASWESPDGTLAWRCLVVSDYVRGRHPLEKLARCADNDHPKLDMKSQDSGISE